jgi:hypothetical protein
MKLELITITLRILAALVQGLCNLPLPCANRQADGCGASFPFQFCNANTLCAVKTPATPVARNGV